MKILIFIQDSSMSCKHICVNATNMSNFILFQLLLIIVYVLTFSLSQNDGTTWKFGIAASLNDTPSFPELDHNYPIILWWTKSLYPHAQPIEVAGCSRSKCYVTNERSFLQHNQTRAIYIYGTEFEIENLPLPRLPTHMWALLHEESPLNNFMLDHTVSMNVFNYTATYSRHSDYPLTLLSFPGERFLLDRQPISTDRKTIYQTAKGHAPVVYVQSHCEVPSDRDRYVEELMKYIPVDSYGKCLHNKDLPTHLATPVENMFHDQFKDLMAEYKFILSFENGICNDYMTEKLFRSLHVGGVPVYKGSPLVRDFAPDNHSIILVDDFESPKHLADYLMYLNENDEEYENYLEFKRKKEIINPTLKEMIKSRPWPFTEDDKNYGHLFQGFECYLCDRIHERLANEMAHEKDPEIPLLPPKLTDGKKYACPAPEPYWKPEKLDWWFIYDYPEQYWHGLDQARALRDMVLAGEADPSKYNQYIKKYSKHAHVSA